MNSEHDTLSATALSRIRDHSVSVAITQRRFRFSPPGPTMLVPRPVVPIPFRLPSLATDTSKIPKYLSNGDHPSHPIIPVIHAISRTHRTPECNYFPNRVAFLYVLQDPS